MSSERAELQRELEGRAELGELQRLAQSEEAAQLIERLASAVLPPERRGIAHLTWNERRGPRERTDADPRAVAEARLRAAEARFRSLVEQIPAVTFLAALGEGENEVYVSPHIEALLGFSQSEWLDNPFLWYEQLHPDDRALWNDEFARGCARGGPFLAECRFFARDGSVVWVHGEARIIKDELGRPLYLQGIAFDITESKKAQAILFERAMADAKLEEELAIARRIQTTILPRDLSVQGLEVSAIMRPAEEVGGDYYDVLPFDGGAWLGIGDVSGHGLQAGVVMLMLQSALAGIVSQNGPASTPSALVTALNRVLYENVRSRMRQDDHVTMTLLRYTSDGRVLYAGAHEYLLIFRHATGAVEQRLTPGAWLGAFRDVGRVMSDSELWLSRGDVLVLFTDGITEAMNAEHEQLGLEPVCNAITQSAHEPTSKIAEHVLRVAEAFMLDRLDDMSIVVARYTGVEGERP